MKKTHLNLIMILSLVLICLALAACGNKTGEAPPVVEAAPFVVEQFLPRYAHGFSADIYDDGTVLLRMADGGEYLLLYEGSEAASYGHEKASAVRVPVTNLYLAASSAMDLFVTLDTLDTVRFCSTQAKDYSIPEAVERIESGAIRYVGKYSAPDYEALLSGGCSLAVESTMISHSPSIREQLERLGIPVLVERSSYETTPLGRLEWIRLYGFLTGRNAEAEAYFALQQEKLQQLEAELAAEGEKERPSMAFFYVSSNGYVNVRKPGDYLTAMIETAGGRYALDGVAVEADNALGTMNINWEEFYSRAVNADILVYNGTIDGGIQTLNDLIAKNALFADFKAVKTGNVYCTNMNMFQCSGAAADVILDLARVLKFDYDAPLSYLFRLPGPEGENA